MTALTFKAQTVFPFALKTGLRAANFPKERKQIGCAPTSSPYCMPCHHHRLCYVNMVVLAWNIYANVCVFWVVGWALLSSVINTLMKVFSWATLSHNFVHKGQWWECSACKHNDLFSRTVLWRSLESGRMVKQRHLYKYHFKYFSIKSESCGAYIK